MTTLTQQTQEAAHEHSYGNLLYASHHAGFIAGAQWERDREKWIKVEDQLPKEDRERPGYSIGIWATDGEMQFTCRYYFPAGKWIAAFKKVTHWQPLPQPPKT